MEIFWHGNSQVTLKAKNLNIGFNPKSTQDLGLIVYSSPTPSVKSTKEQFVVSTPGEYEVKSAMVYSLLDAKGNTGAYQLVADDLSFFYVDNLSFLPNESQVDDMGTIDVAFIPVGGGKEGELHAQKLVELIDPRIIIPIATDDDISSAVCLDLAKILGLKCEQSLKSYKIKDRKQLPVEEQLFITLEKS